MPSKHQDKTEATEPEVIQPSPARQKDQARDVRDEKGREVPGAEEVDGAGAEEDKYD